MNEVVLCADGESLLRPALLGLSGENLAAQDWLKPISRADEARRYLRADDAVQEVWVASSDEMDPINLAAALKHDACGRAVFLVAAKPNGSLRSRASSAGIDGVIDAKELANRYTRRKTRRTGFGASAMATDGRSDSGSQDYSRSRSSSSRPSFRMVDPSIGRPMDGGVQRKPAFERMATDREDDGRRTAPFNAGQLGRSAYLLSVVSASGGTGKSAVSVLSALIAQSMGCRTLLLDGDLQFGDAAHLLSVKESVRIDQVIRDPSCLSRLTPSEKGPALLAPPLGVEDAEQLVERLEWLIGQLRTRFDVIVVNTGAFWTEEHIRLLELSSNTLFLLDQRPSCLGATKRALQLCARCGIAATPFLFAVNRCTKGGMLTSLDISCALNGAKVAEFRDGGREVSELLDAGLASELLHARNGLCQSLQAFLAETLPRSLQPEAPQQSDATHVHRIVPFRRKRRA